jgi:RHS repeat-associated protein
MAGISSKAAGGLENKIKFGGKELQSKEFSDGSGLELYDFHARQQDPQIGRWTSVDPLADKFSHQSLYVTMDNTPLNIIDPTGMSGTSTHTDKDGKVIAVYDDKDLGVYKHNGNTLETRKELASKYSKTNTSAGGTKMGETPHWDEFLASHPDKNGIRWPTSSDGVTGYTIDFGNTWDATLLEKMTEAKNMPFWEVAEESENSGSFSLQDDIALNAQGRLFKGKYTSTESMGNYLAGYNARQAGMSTYSGFQRIAGALELRDHGRKDIQMGKFNMTLLALGFKSYGTYPLYGEVIQQYRMSRLGWDDYVKPQGVVK